MKITVFVPFTVLIPWANYTSSFAKNLSQIFLFGPLTRYIYSWETPDIWWLIALASLTCRNCAANAKFGTVFFLQLNIKLELGPHVSTLGCCSGRTFCSGTGTSGRIVYGPEGYMWTLRWQYVGLFPSSSSMRLGHSEGIGLASVGQIVWDIVVDLVTGCYCGGSTVWCILAATLEKITESCSIATIWESLML